ncbi:MAG: NAD(P)/FAD-dependent oxidoreductase [Myxococcales bacterium]|nr:NAD(P)/FAD-dependent oxidoreductase [Myxococcales bacterium]
MRGATEYDAIVIGSGMGGLTTAAALSRMERKVLLLEQAQQIGGLTHTFSREGFSWDVGLHYCGSFGRDQPAGKMLDWLSGGAIEFRSVGTVYDTLHFPDGFELAVGRPADAFKMELKERFPGHKGEIDAYFEALQSGDNALRLTTAERSMPEPFRSAHRWWNKKKIQRWCNRTTGDVIADIISEPKLAAVLSAQWGTFGGIPDRASFAIHATVMNHYLDGAGYPAGGASAIAGGLVPVIEAAGGCARAATPVEALLIEDGAAVGVRTSLGDEIRAPVVVSAIGAGETVKRLLPDNARQQPWAVEISRLEPSVCHFEVYLGFEGDIARHGATRSGHWFHESWDTNEGLWRDLDGPIPSVYASFPSLKDETHDPGPRNRHTGQFMVLADWSGVAELAEGRADVRSDEWKAFKKNIQSRMMAYYTKKFPALAPLVVYQELGTPLATARFTAHEKGGFYGLETTPRRVLSEALSPRTPIRGLYLSGQDVMLPGIAGALWGGMLSAAAIDPRVYKTLMSA